MNSREIVGCLVDSVGLTGKPRPLKSAIEKELIQLGVVAIVAAEEAEQKLSAVKKIIDNKDKVYTENGEIYALRLRGISQDAISGSCYIFPNDTPEVATAKKSRIHAGKIEEQIQKLNFSDFEKFSAKVLNLLGATNPKVTPRSDDQGIDFYGEISIGAIEGLPEGFFHLSHGIRFIIVGQAKHYPKAKIGPSHIRELVGAMSLSRTGTFSKESIDLFDGLKIAPFAPILAVIFSTGEFTPGARTLAKEAGLITFSGHQLATFLADKSVGLELENGNLSFSAAKFNEWLHG